MAHESAEKAAPNRMGRQRRKTHDRLINAALSVMARKGAEAATINDITEAADVGFGSFYNHFSSKEDIFTAATEALFDRIGTQIDAAIDTIPDPCEALAAAVRIFVNTLIVKPEWAQFIIRTMSVPGYKHFGMYPRLFRDIRKIEQAERLRIVDPGTVTYAVGGAMLFMIVALLEGDLPAKDAPERMTAMALRMLGEKESEIARIIALPLPKLDETYASLLEQN
ncbi:TetR/AcrR family transcriptional regulator [Rhodoblastus sp.]|uniref:TetR/AcrR family transcriptional regulator n=1 Tax=Rhodoblastus sp. TaxID=1962975 RepID=UPI003F95011C